MTLTTLSQPAAGQALTVGTYADVPGLTTNANSAGTYHISAAVTFQNTAPSAGTEIGLELVANNQVVDTRILSFAPNSSTFSASQNVEANLDLFANESVKLEAAVLNTNGSAAFTPALDNLRLIRFATPPVVTNPGNQSSNAGASASLNIATNDSDGGPISYSAVDLPVGLNINASTGVISGKLGDQAAMATPYSVTVTASDGVNTGSTTFSWAVSAATRTTLTASPNPAVAGQPVVFTATVSAIPSNAGTPMGTVTFMDGGTALGATTLNGSGVAMLTISSQSVGQHSITAVYSGVAPFLGSTSDIVVQTINPSSPPPPPPPHVPPLLALFNEFLGGLETVNANGTTITDNVFGFPMVETYDYSGNLVSVTLLGFNITFLFG